LTGNLDKARKYLEKSLEKETTKNDFLNLAHIYWCMHNKPKAIENYRKSLLAANMDSEWFAQALMDDGKYLSKYDIPVFDIPLMVDYITMSAGQ
jgi:tetratricopeptide (TPR) repeat protein